MQFECKDWNAALLSPLPFPRYVFNQCIICKFRLGSKHSVLFFSPPLASWKEGGQKETLERSALSNIFLFFFSPRFLLSIQPVWLVVGRSFFVWLGLLPHSFSFLPFPQYSFLFDRHAGQSEKGDPHLAPPPPPLPWFSGFIRAHKENTTQDRSSRVFPPFSLSVTASRGDERKRQDRRWPASFYPLFSFCLFLSAG